MEQNKKVPAIRFKGFEDGWIYTKLSDDFNYKNGKGHEDKQNDSGKYELINLNSISIDGGFKPSGKYIESADETLEKDDLVMILSDVGHGDLLGRVAIIPENDRFVLNQRVALLRLKNNNSDYVHYFFHYINTHQKYFKINGAGMSQLNISKGTVENYQLLKPKIVEQTQIGNFFKIIDEQITLLEQKHQKLVNLKNAMLEKMFPKEGANVPEIRFEGFTDEWIIYKMSEVFNFNISTNSLSRIQLDEKNGQILNVHYGDILVKYSTVLDLEKNKVIPYIKDGKLRDYKNQFLKDGDIVFADAAEDLIVGKAVEIYNVKNNYIVSGLHTIVARPIFYFEKYFLGYYLNSFSYRKQLIAMSQGTKVLSLSKTNFKNTIIKYPDILEQQKIGAYFENLDHLISQSQTQINKYKNIKQALLQKMFV